MGHAKTKKQWVKIILNAVKKKGECWEYKHRTDKNGYSYVFIGGRGGKNTSVHRLIYKHFKGEIKKGLSVCHSCDNPPCCNPDHLFAGTHGDNMKDMVKKGRVNNPFGEKSHACKFSDEEIKKIRNYPGSYSEIMKKFNISKSHISYIKNFKTRNKQK